MTRYVPFGLVLIFILSCTTDNSINYNDSSNLAKPADLEDISSVNTNDYIPVDNFNKSIEKLVYKLLEKYKGDNTAEEICALGTFLLGNIAGVLSEGPSQNEVAQAGIFRDDFLLKSEKGNTYNNCYILLSNYAYKNDLIMRYPSEHLSVFNIGFKLSDKLRNERYDDMILLNYADYAEYKQMINIYRNTKNHNEIDSILDYLEADLDNYYNKTKAEIAADFN